MIPAARTPRRGRNISRRPSASRRARHLTDMKVPGIGAKHCVPEPPKVLRGGQSLSPGHAAASGMPAIVIQHSYHYPKTQGELQDMASSGGERDALR